MMIEGGAVGPAELIVLAAGRRGRIGEGRIGTSSSGRCVASDPGLRTAARTNSRHAHTKPLHPVACSQWIGGRWGPEEDADTHKLVLVQ